MRKFWLIQFVANALIIVAIYQWLDIRDSRTSQLILSFALGVAILAGAVLLHSRTFHIKPLRFGPLLVVFLLIVWGFSMISVDSTGVWIASTLTHAIRKPVRPSMVEAVLNWLRIFVEWVVIPLLLLRKKSPKFWAGYVAVLVVGFWVPAAIVNWTPKLVATWLQVASFLLRFGVAYCLITTGFVAFWRLTGTGSPEVSQPSTVALP